MEPRSRLTVPPPSLPHLSIPLSVTPPPVLSLPIDVSEKGWKFQIWPNVLPRAESTAHLEAEGHGNRARASARQPRLHSNPICLQAEKIKFNSCFSWLTEREIVGLAPF